VRVLPAQRRRWTRPPSAAPRDVAGDRVSTTPASDLGDDATAQPGFTGIAAGWLIDPSGRHQQRYWSGSAWTEHVMDGGVPATDPPPGAGGAEAS
jgi:hypothetical protein